MELTLIKPIKLAFATDTDSIRLPSVAKIGWQCRDCLCSTEHEELLLSAPGRAVGSQRTKPGSAPFL